jgi:predicted nucleotidyltransferase component of viral defense system
LARQVAEELEKLLAEIINLFADRFAEKAVLQGGMALKILGSQRYTNDLDYVFTPFKSKNEIIEMIVSALKELKQAKISHSINSKCLRVKIIANGVVAQVEAKAAKELKTVAATTKIIAEQHGLPKRIIQLLDPSIAFANKLAAWNERRIVRDLYDIWFFLQMNIEPDPEVLLKRLKKPNYSRLVAEKTRFKGSSLKDFYEFIRLTTKNLSDQEILQQLAPILPADEALGFSLQLRAALTKLK